jgi:hypothetical protein
VFLNEIDQTIDKKMNFMRFFTLSP